MVGAVILRTAPKARRIDWHSVAGRDPQFAFDGFVMRDGVLAVETSHLPIVGDLNFGFTIAAS